ncbi:hypothetical protein FI667_g2, partial [Globisporangium splendens]
MGEYAELSIQASVKSDKRKLSPEVSMTNMEQPREGAARKEAPEGVSTKTAITLRSGQAQVDAEMAIRPSQHEKGGALDPSGTIEEGTTPSRAEGSRKEASTETAPVERYEAFAAKLRVSPNAVNRVEIEYEVRLMFTALYNGMRILEKPKKANDNYPTLNGEEADALVDLFRLLAVEKEKSFPEWKRTIQDLCKDMHRSSWTVVALIQKRIDQNRLAAETKASPWVRVLSDPAPADNDGMGYHASDRGRRTPDSTLASIPMTTQVEGELVGKLSDATQVYKDHQSTGRIVEAILQAARFRNDDKMEETMAMLRDLKAAEYNDSTHSLHFYFFDRSTATKWNKMTIPSGANWCNSYPRTRWRQPESDRRQTACGTGNWERTGYRMQNRDPEYLKQTTGKRFHAYPLDEYGPRSHQLQLWEVLFEDELCPKALIDVRRIIWRGRTIILHHASKYRMAPCLICGAAGHFARAYDEIVSKLPRKPATFTSAAEMEATVLDSIDKQKQPLQPATEARHASGKNKPSENTNPVTPDETNTSSPQPNSNPNNLTKNASSTLTTEISGQQTGNLKEQEKAKPNGGAANTKGPASKASQKNGPNQISKDGIRWAKELMRFRRDMDELMKVHVERQTELNPNRNDIMDWDGEYTLQDVMDANGLAEATTPPTGNCQFYAVAEAVLQITHDSKANEKLLEATASRIKKSMNAAARLNFDPEFPEGTHLGILEALRRGDRKMSPKERRADILNYFSDIASSSSSRSSALPGSLWGGPESLRMAAKALQRKIFVLIETMHADRKGFAIYKPQSKVHAGVYLLFRTLNDPSPLANITSSSLAKHLQGSERSKTEFKTDRSGQFDSERETDDSMEDSDNSSLEEGPTLVDLTHVLREQVIEEGPKRLAHRTDQAETREDWSTLGKMKYGGFEVLRLCHPTQLEKLSRYIICAVVYEEELQTFRSSDAEDPDNLETQLIEESKWANRTLAIKSKGVVWINVYAPNKKSEREHFFRRLNEESVTHQEAAVLGGDFNCVLDKQRDRYQRGVLQPVQCESAELRRLVTEWNIHDARELVEDPEWPVQREPTEHFTYWRKNSASRLDRFYIAGNLGSAVQWEAIELPKRYSDHQAVVLHMKWTSQPQRPRKVNKCRYPMRTSRPDLVRTGVQKAIAHELELMQSEGQSYGATWSSVSSKQY